MSADADLLAAMDEALRRLDRALNPHLRGLSRDQRLLRKELLAYRRHYRDYGSWCKVTPWFDAEGCWHWDDSPAEETWTAFAEPARQEARDAVAHLEGLCREWGEAGFLAAALGLRARLLYAFGSSRGEVGDLAAEALRLAQSSACPNLVSDLEKFLEELRAGA